jgi:hypothetical protein
VSVPFRKRETAEALAGPGEAPEALAFSRRVVSAKRRRELHAACPFVPCEVVDSFGGDPADFLEFAVDRVAFPVRDAVRYALARRAPRAAEVFSIDLRRLVRGELVPAAPRLWALLRGRPPIRLWRVRAPLEGGG